MLFILLLKCFSVCDINDFLLLISNNHLGHFVKNADKKSFTDFLFFLRK